MKNKKRREHKTKMVKSVYFYPATLQFFADDPNSHKQIITIYNPLDFNVKFKGNILISIVKMTSEFHKILILVLTTAPKKYTIDEPEGTIKSKSCIEL